MYSIINKLFHPFVATFLLMVGIGLAATLDRTFGYLVILGGILLGFSSLRGNVETLDRKAKTVLFGSFIFLFLFMSLGFFLINTFFF